MDQKKPHLAVIGAGYISRFHFAAFQKLGADVRVVADPNMDAARAAAAPFNAATVARWEEAVARPDVDTVAVYAPSPLHSGIARAALEAGKHVICEKTLTTSAADSLALARLAEERGRLLFTGYMKRFFPAVQKAKSLVPSLGHIMGAHVRTWHSVAPHDLHTGELPSIWQGSEHAPSAFMRGSGGGMLVCGGSHALDMLLHLVGEPGRVYARQLRRPGSDLDMMTNALFEFADGGAAHFEANWHPLAAVGFQQGGFEEVFEINGVNGRIVLETPVWNEPLRNAARLRHYDNAAQTWTDYATPVVCPFEKADEFFLSQIARNSQCGHDRLTGWRVDYLLGQPQRSADTRQPVELDWSPA
ncbi:MAG: Gfo/Idh/MocA family oxidoreductase [Kiritimatiellaeota bacterium]|nr:Gfo/Idh/MocA family oxidoreductase [Kiritimatiellota bacterium]